MFTFFSCCFFCFFKKETRFSWIFKSKESFTHKWCFYLYSGRFFIQTCEEFHDKTALRSAYVHWIYNCFCLTYMSFSSFSFPTWTSSVSISHEEWCWKHKSVEVDVLDADVLGVEFRQIGYILRCSLSHAITLVSNLFIQAWVSESIFI